MAGGEEPLYLPADKDRPYHELFFAHGFFRSALHECSHWLIAGEERRKQVDFGYWYAPDGRTSEQQQAFLQVEVKPQAMEWILSMACAHPFCISLDNLNGDTSDSDTQTFKFAVYQQVKKYCEQGLPERAIQLRNALCDHYVTSKILKIENFNVRE